MGRRGHMGKKPDPRQAVFSAYAVSLIRHKSLQLIRKPGFSRSDREDLEHDLSLHLWKKAHQFDPRRASIETFADRVIKSAVRMILRDRRRRRLALGKVESIESGTVNVDHTAVPLDEIISEQDRGRRVGREPHDHDVPRDVRDVVDRLSPELKSIVDAILSTDHLSKAAESTGLARSTFYLRLKEIRREFEDAGLSLP